ncbi:MAG: MBL fold metallo-hydrolase [Chthoniobacterales bacterium]|nr:MBL fold metallo-hydrolase [Chthoniobacterales bacterium]
MTTIHHLNCGVLHAPPYPRASCHCLLLEGPDTLTLIDTGIGLADVANPLERIGRPLIDIAGFKFNETDTAVRQIERLGFRATDVTDVVLTRGDPDHTGGLADFPEADIHISEEEHARVLSGNARYLPAHFAHGPRWKTYPPSTRRWFGLEARPIALCLASEVLLIPLAGHTLCHSGVAIQQGERWLLHVGDAYYLRVELVGDNHPVSALTTQRADDDALRRQSLEQLRRLARDHQAEVEIVGYHDFTEFPQ